MICVRATLIKSCSIVVFTCTFGVQTNRQTKMKQQTLARAADQAEGFEPYRRPTRRDTFLATMHQIVPWQELCAVIEPHCPKAGNGRPPIGLERMLRMYFVQHRL